MPDEGQKKPRKIMILGSCEDVGDLTFLLKLQEQKKEKPDRESTEGDTPPARAWSA